MSNGDTNVIPLRPIADRLTDEQPVELVKHDRSFEVDLDEMGGEDPRTLRAVPVDQPPLEVERRAVIPTYLHTWEGVRSTARLHTGRAGHVAAFHAVRAPVYLLLACWYALIGVLRLVNRQIRWWWRAESAPLKREAIIDNDPHTYTKLDKDDRAVRLYRGIVLGLQAAALLAAAGVLYVAPRWITFAVVAVAVPILARIGRPADRPIVGSALVKARFRKLNSDIVLRAYHVAGLGHPDKPDQQIAFGSSMTRDQYNRGSQVVVDLPHGRTFDEAMAARGKIASGLDVALSQVYLTRDHSSHRRHLLWVADVDPLSIPAGRTPLLDCKPRDIWKPAPLGVNERGVRVALPLMWTSILVGAQPRKGKTFTARSLALFAALDPYVRLSVFDAKGSPDWRRFALVAYTYGFGMLPDRIQGDPIENLKQTLRAAKREVQNRNARLSELPTNVCPEGKLTRDIARDPRYKMPVWMIVLDEFQDFLNTGDTDTDEEIADLLVFLVKQGPSTGILFDDATQRPSGIGSTGKVAKKFTDFRDNHQTRFALKVGSWQVSELVLGAGAYSEGFDASILPVGDGTNGGPDYRGIGILYDAPVDPGTVRTYLADGKDAEKILLAARRLREQRGTLDGMAAGDIELDGEVVDPVTDALSVMMADEAKVQWADLAARLAEAMPDRYAGLTADAISSRLRGLGLRSQNVRRGESVAKGVARAELEQLAASRAVQR